MHVHSLWIFSKHNVDEQKIKVLKAYLQLDNNMKKKTFFLASLFCYQSIASLSWAFNRNSFDAFVKIFLELENAFLRRKSEEEEWMKWMLTQNSIYVSWEIFAPILYFHSFWLAQGLISRLSYRNFPTWPLSAHTHLMKYFFLAQPVIDIFFFILLRNRCRTNDVNRPWNCMFAG
jgi:hypothetical protein